MSLERLHGGFKKPRVSFFHTFQRSSLVIDSDRKEVLRTTIRLSSIINLIALKPISLGLKRLKLLSHAKYAEACKRLQYLIHGLTTRCQFDAYGVWSNGMNMHTMNQNNLVPCKLCFCDYLSPFVLIIDVQTLLKKTWLVKVLPWVTPENCHEYQRNICTYSVTLMSLLWHNMSLL